jgi:hypothetical protein
MKECLALPQSGPSKFYFFLTPKRPNEHGSVRPRRRTFSVHMQTLSGLFTSLRHLGRPKTVVYLYIYIYIYIYKWSQQLASWKLITKSSNFGIFCNFGSATTGTSCESVINAVLRLMWSCFNYVFFFGIETNQLTPFPFV